MSKKSFRNLQHREILVKVHFTTISPFDILFIKGEYGEIEPKSFPVIPGFEGSGQVVQVENEADLDLLGKQVACFANSNKEGYFEGLWAEYHYTIKENVIVFDSKKQLPYENICFLINPLTAVGMLDTVKKAKAKTVLQTDADSPLSEMFIRLCKKEQIETINITRNFHNVKKLIEIGSPNIIVTEDGDWELECKKQCQLLNAQVAFDSVGGSLTGKILSCLPEDATIYQLGSNLSQKEVTRINISDLVFQGKSLTGFWMVRWLRSLNAEEYQYWWDYIKKELQYQSRTFETKISKFFNLDTFDEAISYHTLNPLEGNVIINLETKS